MISCYLITDAAGVATVVETMGEQRAIWLWREENGEKVEIKSIVKVSNHGAIRDR